MFFHVSGVIYLSYPGGARGRKKYNGRANNALYRIYPLYPLEAICIGPFPETRFRRGMFRIQPRNKPFGRVTLPFQSLSFFSLFSPRERSDRAKICPLFPKNVGNLCFFFHTYIDACQCFGARDKGVFKYLPLGPIHFLLKSLSELLRSVKSLSCLEGFVYLGLG